MDFSDLSYPVVANADYSPTNETLFSPDAFDEAYIMDSYTTSPDHSLASFDCNSFFDQPLSTVEVHAPGAFGQKNPAVFSATLPAATVTPANQSAPYSPTLTPAQLEQFPSGFSFDGVSNAFESNVTPKSQHSRTPFCGDGTQQCQVPSSLELSPRSTLKRDPTDEGVQMEEPMPKRPQRKRGRPRLDRSNSNTSPASSNCHRTSRLPHNQVERKYREGLNSELEKLRRAVPTLPQSEEGQVIGQPKPSKAMVLAAAIDYIKKVEKERNMDREIPCRFLVDP
ncbi:hypothetical protein BU26DRAFT_185313 [Trematosphaeria pertusa]|uniref:BHLH domain-containing protein n=1 Tax=Trematosphaeria pertusa TaxID=390896 RepID=A0A6A6HSU5_9PLEO|nr:uncharacterized protein BU26DRAFT_185313 [Trematosphaeria pertusa]KAF2240969.1 hypothetical protein BU26DRAFT_185313 [Trematosphaeria pertusa]